MLAKAPVDLTSSLVVFLDWRNPSDICTEHNYDNNLQPKFTSPFYVLFFFVRKIGEGKEGYRHLWDHGGDWVLGSSHIFPAFPDDRNTAHGNVLG